MAIFHFNGGSLTWEQAFQRWWSLGRLRPRSWRCRWRRSRAQGPWNRSRRWSRPSPSLQLIHQSIRTSTAAGPGWFRLHSQKGPFAFFKLTRPSKAGKEYLLSQILLGSVRLDMGTIELKKKNLAYLQGCFFLFLQKYGQITCWGKKLF